MPVSDDPISNFETNSATFRSRQARRDPGNFTQPPSPEMKRRVLDIEDVLWWTYRDELPKSFRGEGSLTLSMYPAVSPMFSMVALGGRVDNWSREPGFPAAIGETHPDAFKVKAAVERLSRFRDQPLEGDLGLAPDLAALGVDEEKAMRHALLSVEALVVRCAKLKTRPFWTSKVSPSAVTTPVTGKPTVVRWETIRSPAFGNDCSGASREVDEERLVPIQVRQKGVYPTGSHCPLKFEPAPDTVVSERADYAVWWGALNALAAELQGQLDSIAVLEPGAAQRPWTNQRDLGKPTRVFEDLTARVYKTQARQTAEAYRLLGARRSVGTRSPSAYRAVAPKRVHVVTGATG